MRDRSKWPRRAGPKKHITLACAISTVLLSAVACASSRPTLDLYLLDAPPLTLLGQDGRYGIVGDATFKAAAMAGYDLHLVSLPWARAQRTVAAGEDQLIIPLSRTPDREDRYTWVAPIMTMDRAFFSLDKRVDSFEEARRTYHRIAVGMGSAQEIKLREEGFSNEQIYPLKIGENPAQMLLLGRVDAWFNGVPESRHIWGEVSRRTLLMSPALMTADLYLACSRRCAEPMVSRLRAALEALRANGTLEQIVEDYSREPPSLDSPARPVSK
ncbi:transporter substrate-binding domain-containing protein [Pseudomonas sp. dw_358]|uniref:substrate-binding periplasmic protein n=1 Tax=Pseudomonas sp. dw_358 TaxID=2720083 RepID=UPI001BD6874D|nr:transporter substrate-binding domain-containing protein [Pseudomonas sp. dw_358]